MSRSSGTYLDLGAGDGAILRSAVEQGLLFRFNRIVAVDVSAKRIERLLAQPRLANVEGIVASAAALPLADASVDFVFSHQVIEHVPDDGAFAREISRVLRPEGHAFVSSVSKRWYGWYFYRCNGKFRLDPTHVREYRDALELGEVLRRAGLHVVSFVDRPLGHPLDKIALRALTVTGLVPAQRAQAFFVRNRVLGALRGRELRIPGYRYADTLSVKT